MLQKASQDPIVNLSRVELDKRQKNFLSIKYDSNHITPVIVSKTVYIFIIIPTCNKLIIKNRLIVNAIGIIKYNTKLILLQMRSGSLTFRFISDFRIYFKQNKIKMGQIIRKSRT